MARGGRGLRFAAWLLGPAGLVLLVTATVLLNTGYTTMSIVSQAMEPMYSPGEHVILKRINAGEVRRGDVVLYRTPDRYQGKAVLQRVIGIGGDRVADRPGAQVTVNGRPIAEPYVKGGDPSGSPAYDVLVPQGRLFLLGDNRADSYDCRYFLSDQSGTVPATAVLAEPAQDRTGIVQLALAVLLGLVLALTGLALGVAARIARKRNVRALEPPAPF